MEQREHWRSTTAFIFAAIGSAVGLGNLLRYPMIAHRYGGGLFLVPYVIALLTIGVPILQMEFALGQVYQQSSAGAFASSHRRAHGIGLTASICAFLIVTYYNVILSWSWTYLLGSFTAGSLPWESETEAGEHQDPAVEEFFSTQVLNEKQFGEVPGLGHVFWKPALGTLLNWLLTYFCVFKSVSSIGAVIYVTLPLPFVLLVILFVHSTTLDGFNKGISNYMGAKAVEPSKLEHGDVWADAAAQIFFGLSVCESSQIAYGSKNPKDSRAARNGWIVALANTATSLFAGLVIFAGIGFLSERVGKPVDEIVKDGWALAFEVYPAVIARLPNGAKQTISITFWIMLLTLGIDSSFALAEGVVQLLCDTFTIAEKYHKSTAALVCLAGFLIGLPLMTQNGYSVLEIQDAYISRVTLIVVGLAESLAIGWVYGAKRFDTLVERVSGRGMGSLWVFCIRYVTPLLLFLLFIWNIVKEAVPALREPESIFDTYPTWSIVVFGWVYGVILPIGAGVFCGFFPARGVNVLAYAPSEGSKLDGKVQLGEETMSLSSLERAERNHPTTTSEDGDVDEDAKEYIMRNGESSEHAVQSTQAMYPGATTQHSSDGGFNRLRNLLSRGMLPTHKWRQI